MTQPEWDRLTPAERAKVRVLPKDPTPGHALYQAKEGGYRVEITYEDGHRFRCYVGMSTGWRPCFLAILTRRSYGGGPLETAGIASVRRVEGRR